MLITLQHLTNKPQGLRKQNTLADPLNGSSRRVFLLSASKTTSTTKGPEKRPSKPLNLRAFINVHPKHDAQKGANFKPYDASNRISILCRHTFKPSSSRCHSVIRQAANQKQRKPITGKPKNQTDINLESRLTYSSRRIYRLAFARINSKPSNLQGYMFIHWQAKRLKPAKF